MGAVLAARGLVRPAAPRVLPVGVVARVGDGAPPPKEDELRAFYAAHLERFSRAGRVAVEPLFFAGDAQLSGARAQAARARLVGGEPLAAVESAADPPPVPVPRTLLTVAALADSVGRAAALAVDALPPAGVTQPVPVPGGVWVVRLAAREAGEIAPFDEARDDVRVEWRRAMERLP